MKNELTIKDELTEFLLYTTPNGNVKVEIFFHNENIWLTQKRMAELFGVNIPAISKHLNNIYESNELEKEATISILETVQNEGDRTVKRKMEYYNLDNGTIGVGKSAIATALKNELENSVMLDGDWCWMMNPWKVTEENKKMVKQITANYALSARAH
jgi:predicted XRE-type DNA-binding protein